MPKVTGTYCPIYSGCNLFPEDGGNSEILIPTVNGKLGRV
jgi:hypothetical protein